MELLMVTHDLFTYNYYNPLPVLECQAPPPPPSLDGAAY